MTIKICILETDFIREDLVQEYQGYGAMFERMFAQQPIAVQCKIYNVVNGDYPAADEQWDAYLVTGSKADSFATDPWIETLKSYVKKLYKQGKIILGVCFGHQLLALVFGGKVERAVQGWGVGSHNYEVNHKANWMMPALDKLTLLISHQDQVTLLPEQATLIAKSDFCPNAAFTIGKQVLCFQGHPEFVVSYAKAIFEGREAQLGEALYNKAISSLSVEHQGTVVAEWMVRFVQEGLATAKSKMIVEQKERELV